ncbi:YciI family protein [Fodinibius salsisoli]|uniref:YCII-related domain-containing protein n=1 Tax=Fodinibius salsisoli TaxID=2820877 RepID=A0ABT3PRC6_9BACT|nr:YciI family protein [Fodinibius salsisoli]MCW9708414.1 hypothetical protein [Fodinibius salsisoli]
MKKIMMCSVGLLISVSAWAQEVDSSKATVPETFEMESGDTTYVMQKYFMVFLKRGPERSQDEQEAATIQKKHLAYLNKMYEMGKTSITGPFGDDGEIRGIVIYNTATKEEALKLAKQDPAVQAGRLEVEIHPFWSAKGSTLR